MTILRRAAVVAASPSRATAKARTTIIGEAVRTAAGPIIEMRDAVRSYETGAVRVNALQGVSLTVERGEMVAIMGPSGCGKTTLLNCISGLDALDGGTVSIAGVDLTTMSDTERTTYRARSMGFIFQTYNLLPVLSAVENVELPLIVSGVSPRAARTTAVEALEAVGLPQVARQWPSQLSGGQRQRVTIARALVNNPESVWADEPTGALDSTTADEIMTLMEGLNRSLGLTFVIVTHDRAVGARCNRIVRMQDGRITGEEQVR
jgi:putative ABC transport system ATP-binding protein